MAELIEQVRLATQALAEQVQALAEAGEIAQPKPLLASIDAALKHLQRGENTSAANELGALLAKIAAETITGRVSLHARYAKEFLGGWQTMEFDGRARVLPQD